MARTLPFKPRDAQATRRALLEAAQKVFSRTSYAQAGIRQIAAEAGVSPAMALRYFGSKSGLFEAAMIEAVPTQSALMVKRSAFGETIARELLNPSNEIRPPLMMALSSGEPEASQIAERVMFERGIVVLSDWLDGDDARERAMAITMIATGFALYLRQFDWPDLSAAERERLSGWFARQIQALVDAPDLP